MKLIKGIAVSSGIAIAKAMVLKDEVIDVSQKNVSDVAAEIASYKSSIETSVKQIVQLKESVVSKLGADKAAVFDAHVQFATDPFTNEQIINKIEGSSCNAVFAVRAIYDEGIAMFKSLEGIEFQERAADLEDVSLRIIKNILGIQIQDLSQINTETIIISNDLTPSQTSQLDPKFVKGFATNIGGRTSHSAIMARTLEITAVVGSKDITSQAKDGDMIIVDGNAGTIIVNPTTEQLLEAKTTSDKFNKEKQELLKFVGKKATTTDGVTFKVFANIGAPKDVEKVLEVGADGVGLFRSEFLYMDASAWPTEEEQFEAYKKVVVDMNKKTVIIRTLDIGGDKKLSYFEFPHEENPFLGYRAIRFTLDNKDVFKAQIRALLRASHFGKLGIMFPMIATIDEVKAAIEFTNQMKADLKAEGIPFGKPLIGIMVEIPSTAEIADKFAKYVDFFSIGTNDLLQYTFAADRMSEKVSYLYQPLNPALIRKLHRVISEGTKAKASKEFFSAMCGEMASEPKAVPLLVGMGLDEFSVSATAVLKTKYLISKFSVVECKKLLAKALKLETESEVIELVDAFMKKAIGK